MTVLVHHAELCPNNPKLRTFIAWWWHNGPFPIKILRGNATDESQELEYSKGRRKLPDGTWIVVNPKAVVTYALRAADSGHGHSGALDAAPVREVFSNGAVKLIYLGDEDDELVRAEGVRRYDVMADIAEKQFGLKSGRDFKHLVDRPHLQDPEWQSRPLNNGVAP